MRVMTMTMVRMISVMITLSGDKVSLISQETEEEKVKVSDDARETGGGERFGEGRQLRDTP